MPSSKADDTPDNTSTNDRFGPEPGEVAWLKVVEVNNTGAFLDWGREKELLLPYREQPRDHASRAVVGQFCLVCILLDNLDRPFATMRLDEWILDKLPDDVNYETGEKVTMTIAGETHLGMKVVVDDNYWGVLYRDEIFQPVRRGDRVEGYVKAPRADRKLDVTLNPPAHVAAKTLSDRVLDAVDAAGGMLALSDKSSPEDIKAAFGVSKGVFKQAIGGLYKQRLIEITDGGIRRT